MYTVVNTTQMLCNRLLVCSEFVLLVELSGIFALKYFLIHVWLNLHTQMLQVLRADCKAM